MGLFERVDKQLMQRMHGWRDHAARRYLPPFFCSLLTFTLLVLATWVVALPVDGMTWVFPEGKIVAVAPAGPGGQAGLRAGDVVLEVDGRPLGSVPPYARHRPNQQVVLTVRRGADIHDFSFLLAAPGPSELLWRLVPVFVALSFWVAGVALFILQPRIAVCRAFFWMGQAAAVALSAGQLSAVNQIWTAHLFHLALLALPPLLAHLYVTLIPVGASIARLAPRWLAGLSGLLAVPEIAALVASFREGQADPSIPWAVPSIPRAVSFLLTWSVWRTGLRLYLGLALLAVTLGLVYAYFTARSGDLRRRLRGLAFGAAIGFLPLLFLSLLPEVLWGVGAGLPYQVGFSFLVLVPLSHAYVVGRRDIVFLDRFLNRSLVVFTLGLIWAGLYLGGVGLGLVIFHKSPLLYPIVGALVTAGLAAVFAPLRERVQRWVDYLFYGGWYDYRQVIAQVSSDLSRVMTRQDLLDCLVDVAMVRLRLRGAALYLRGVEGDLVLERCLGLPVEMATTRPAKQLALAPAGQEWGDGVAWQVPLVHEGRLLGLLLLGEKREDDFFEPADVQILRTLAEQASLATASVFLMHDLRQAVRALEMTQRQVVASREEERRMLAWDLHDGPVQDLVALAYRLSECRDQAWGQEQTLAVALEDARQEAGRIMKALRETCGELRSDVLDVMGLGPAMIQCACKLMEETDVVVYLDVPRRGPMLADPLGITLLRVFQEALNNAVEHAGVREVWTSFVVENGGYELRIWDEGVGFAPPERLETLALSGHFGLVTMQERMAAVRGHLDVHSTPGEGTRIRAWGEVDNTRQAEDACLEAEVSP
jgi:signal transduction histidine kinase